MRIIGYSDDLVVIEDAGARSGEVDRNGHPILLRVGDANRGCYLLWRYADDPFTGLRERAPSDVAACWTVAVIAIDSGDGDTGAPMPDMRIERDRRHGGPCVVLDGSLPVVEIRDGVEREAR